MKRLLILTGFLLLPLSLLATEAQVVEIGVEGMSCKFCARNINKKISLLPGVEKAEVSYEGKKARITMAPGAKADIGQIKKQISEAGFKGVDIKTGTAE